jgi:hypothetical protein
VRYDTSGRHYEEVWIIPFKAADLSPVRSKVLDRSKQVRTGWLPKGGRCRYPVRVR